jgi:3-deoxy-D-manno-octulosonate 8-phosphate phosphatase (KDO 8-P phosphatase)
MTSSAIISATNSASRVRLLILDVDGVLTDGGLQFDNRGEEYKTFNSLDGHGIRMMLENNIEIAVITGRESKIVSHRMNDLGVSHVYQGCRNKRSAFDELLRQTGLNPDQVAYMGDDLPDLPILKRVGLAIAVNNAHSFVKQHCDWVTSQNGGSGAVREATDFILQAQSLLDAMHRQYLK